MADLLPDPPTPRGLRWLRAWHEYADYRVVHERNMESLAGEGIVAHDTVRFVEIVDPRGAIVEINVRGRIETASGALVSVNKWLEVGYPHARLCVRTREYDYHAFVRAGHHTRDMFRYDNCHGGIHTLHRHSYDIEGLEAGRPEPIDHDRMPPLNYVVREADYFARYLAARG